MRICVSGPRTRTTLTHTLPAHTTLPRTILGRLNPITTRLPAFAV